MAYTNKEDKDLKRDFAMNRIKGVLDKAQSSSSVRVPDIPEEERMSVGAPDMGEKQEAPAPTQSPAPSKASEFARKSMFDNVDSTSETDAQLQNRQVVDIEESVPPASEGSGALSKTFQAALVNFLPLAVGGLFEGSEGAVAAHKGAQDMINTMQQRDLNERGMQVKEGQLELQKQGPRVNPLEEKRVEIAEENLRLREKQLELMTTGEGRRGNEQQFQWADRSVQNFEKLAPVKAARETLAAVENADSLIDAALTNPVANAALPTQLARLSGQVGVLTNLDVAIYGTPGSIVNKMSQISEQMRSGTLTEQNATFMKELAATMAANQVKILESEADRVSNQMSQVLGVPSADAKQFLLQGQGQINQGRLGGLPGSQSAPMDISDDDLEAELRKRGL